ncbi:hypothetical protein [Paraliobacillus sp. JSM ZJ581]|uniref:hypothetical protein n=1 Tax=Paraliobacillus sp. JSM ZJ581 TaxID=3342118 RepID=UPI0035A8CAD1
MDKKAEHKEAEKIEAERMSVKALKKEFQDIKSIEFNESEYNEITGSYTFIVKMTNHKNEFVHFMYIYVQGKEKIESSVIENEEVQIDGVTTNKVHVIYSNQKKGEV